MPLFSDMNSRFIRDRADFQPAYIETWESGRLAEKVAAAREELRVCRLCPRNCDIDRLADETGVCRTGRWARVASAFAHHGEENCLRGSRGSGTIFFSHCNLRCIFCQNHDISWEGSGRECDAESLAGMMLELQDRGCHNINFVTPEHVVPQVLEAVGIAAGRGLRLPLVYNTSAYDSLRSIELLDGVVDIYMPDFKIWDPEIGRRLLLAADYPETARQAFQAMHRQTGDLVFDEQGIALRGVLVRHLVMPDGLAGTPEIMRFLAEEISPDTFVNIMGQYSPAAQVVRRPGRYAGIERRITDREYVEAFEFAIEAGLHRFDHWPFH
jgi:putative pyruvate formate lyase activating enzyme